MNLEWIKLMKKIEAIIQKNKLSIVSDAITGIVGGFTIMEGKGRGSGKRQNIRSDRGTNTITAEFNQVVTLITIVDDSMVEKVSKAIEEAAYTGNSTDGIIVISNIESVLNCVEIWVVRLAKFVWERRNLGGRTRNQNCETVHIL